jgi:hypothetical protein
MKANANKFTPSSDGYKWLYSRQEQKLNTFKVKNFRVTCSTLVKQQWNVSVLSRLRSPSQNILPAIRIFTVVIFTCFSGSVALQTSPQLMA